MTHGIKAAAVILLAVFIAVPAFTQSPGADIYKAKCAICHGAKGLADTPMGKNMKILSFKDPKMLAASDHQFFVSTKEGKGKMPPYKDKLTDAQIREVIAFIRILQK